MKLYTEKEVVRAIQLTVFEKPNTYLEVIEKLTPIVLPSDEEIEIASPYVPRDAHDYYHGDKAGFIDGAKWVIEQIKQQDNGN